MGLFSSGAGEREPDPDPEGEEQPLRTDELVPRGGTWSGLLFDNPKIGVPPALTWTFSFAFADVERDFGDSGVSFTVGWVPLPGAAWTSMAGQEAACDTFAEPVETSAYFFEHFRYDAVRLRVLEQEGSRIRVAAEASGDVDGMGIPTWDVEQWLEFQGIGVDLSGVSTKEEAVAALAEHTDTTGLGGGGGRTAWFKPSERPEGR